ncbi:MAG: peptidoglycan editing factor PgeF [Endozoicomonas sp.]
MTAIDDRYLIPDWPVPENIRAAVTTRLGGVSQGSYSSFNLGTRSGDLPEAVAANRQLLTDDWNWSNSPQWLKQVHGADVVCANTGGLEQEADASWTSTVGLPCVVLTADCLPVLFCDRKGTTVAAAHAGWKGLAAGILEETIKAMAVPPGELMAWFGPAISQKHFEVGPEVRNAFLKVQPEAESAFIPGEGDRWMGDLYLLARQRLSAAGVNNIYGGGLCTFEDTRRWYSYRRDGQQSGRLASLVWFDD